jgi:energy-coupling factor transporter ATP-binding protein EcfA2
MTAILAAAARPAVTTALSLRGVARNSGGKALFRNVSADFYAGEITLITGGRGFARIELSRLLSGLSSPDQGRINRVGKPGPTPGAATGFDVGGPVMRGLEMRAAAYGIALNGYAEAIASLMRAPGLLRKPLGKLAAFDRQIVLFGGAYLLPCSHYVTEKALLPTEPAARKALAPLFRQAQSRAAMITLGDKAGMGAETQPHRTAVLFESGLEFEAKT